MQLDEEKINTIIQRLNSTEKNLAFGELIGQLIKSNIIISSNTTDLIKSLEESSKDSNKINNILMYLSIAVALSAIIQSIDILIKIV